VLKRFVAIGVIFCGAGLAWMILGTTLAQRTIESDSSHRERLSSLWGSDLTQRPPRVKAQIGPHSSVVLPILQSRVSVLLALEQRRKGLLWYNLYDVDFAGHYVVRNVTDARQVKVDFTLPDSTYSDFVLRIDGRMIDTASAVAGANRFVQLAPGSSATIDVAYRSRGMESWRYAFVGKGVGSVNDFVLTMKTNFKSIDFPPRTLLPTSEQAEGNGWRLQWKYATLVTGNGIGMTIPYPLQPGPLAQRVTFWAPVSLLFYIFVMLLITTIRRIDLHPMNYFFLACAFFAFHLLLAYLVDRVPLEAAFVICSVVSMFLTISYLRLVVGMRFAAFEGGVVQLIYLVLFSWALFNEGWSGLTITVGAIITLFVAMQLTGRIRWEERLATSRGEVP
jgi:inner membrane protein involved in colicin E2 resistance